MKVPKELKLQECGHDATSMEQSKLFPIDLYNKLRDTEDFFKLYMSSLATRSRIRAIPPLA